MWAELPKTGQSATGPIKDIQEARSVPEGSPIVSHHLPGSVAWKKLLAFGCQHQR